MTTEFFLLVAIGFVAQLIDGALGMAFGVITNGALLMIGMPPAHASALVHTAEVFTTGASAASHIYHRNVDWRLVLRLGMAGVLGAMLGAWILSNVDSRPRAAGSIVYLLLMGCYILLKASRIAPLREGPGGWMRAGRLRRGFSRRQRRRRLGPVVTSTLVGSGHAPRQTVGSVNATEFFVTIAAATTFFVELGAAPLQHLVPLVHRRRARRAVRRLGGEASFGARADDRGRLLIVALSLFQLARLQADLRMTARTTSPPASACTPPAAPTSGAASRAARRSALQASS